jgi:hypothetical protein
VLEGGAWKVSRSTLQHFVQMTAPFRRRPPQD